MSWGHLIGCQEKSNFRSSGVGIILIMEFTILCFVQLPWKFFFFFFFFVEKEFQLMALVFGVDEDWTPNLLFNHQRLYQLSKLEPINTIFFFKEKKRKKKKESNQWWFKLKWKTHKIKNKKKIKKPLVSSKLGGKG